MIFKSAKGDGVLFYLFCSSVVATSRIATIRICLRDVILMKVSVKSADWC
jgi:hypothetical protein